MANARKGGAIIVFDYEGNPIKRYNLTNAWPKSLEIGSLKAGDTNVLTEKLTITYEVMEAEWRLMRRTFDTPRTRRSRAAERATVLRTTFEFELPRGYVDASGTVHRQGTMRLATARDELVPLADDRVRENPPYLTVVLLARVVERIGTVDDVHPGVIENLFASDLAFLQDLYRRVNQEGHARAGGRRARRAARSSRST